MVRNLATSLVLYEAIETTEAKAKEVKSFLDKIIARNKDTSFQTIRNLNAIFFDHNATKKMIEELIPRYESRKSGFIRSYRLKNRLGDNSKVIRLELVDRKVFVEVEKKEIAKDTVKEEKVTEKSDKKVSAKRTK